MTHDFFWSTLRASDLLRGQNGKALVTVGPDSPLSFAVVLMLVHGYSQIPVVDPGGKPIGVLDEVGVMQILTRTPEWLEKPTQWVMGPSLPVVEESRGAKEVVDHLLGGWPAVLIQKGPLLQGIVTKSDLLHRFVQVDAPEYVI